MPALFPRATRLPCVVALCIVGFASTAEAQTWLGGQTSPVPPPYLWSDPTNWSGGVPTAGSTVTFVDPAAPSATYAATRNDLAGLSLAGIAVNASAAGPVGIAGNGFTLTGATGIDMAGGPATQALTIGLDAGQTITLGGPQQWRVGNGTASSNQTLTINSPIAGAVGADLQYGATNLTAGATGFVQLLAANTYAGNTSVGGPNTTFVLGTNSPFGTGTVTQSSFNSAPRYQTNGPVTLSNPMRWGSGFRYEAASAGPLTLNGPITLVDTGVSGQTNRLINNLATQTITVNGTITMSAPGETTAKTFNPQPIVNGPIVVNSLIQDGDSASGLLTKSGTGTAFLNNTANTYRGLTALQNGITEVASLADQGVPSSLGTGATTPEIRLGNAATTGTLRYVGSANVSTNRPLNLFGSGATAGSAIVDSSGTGTMTFTNLLATGNGSKPLVLTGSNTGLNTIGGIIPNASASAITSLQKTGPGTWQVTGANTYTGTTQVNGGTLLVNNAAGIIGTAGAVTVAGATTAGGPFGTLGGAGGIGPAVTVQAGTGGGSNAVIAPGLTTGVSIATLSVGGGLTLPGTYAADIQSAPNLNDLISVNGALNLTGGTLNLPVTNTYDPPANNTTYTLITYTGALTGTFGTVNNPPAGYGVVYSTPGQVNLAPVAVPEPAFLLAACGGLTGLVTWRRKRNR